jgi:molecular chaperone DnaJ
LKLRCGAGFPPGGFPGGGGRGSPFEGIHFESGDFGDLFGNIFGGRRSTGPEPGEDMRGQIEVPFRDAVLGGTATLTLRREKPCPTCGGTGRTGKTVCATCRGEGVVAESERVRIKIPEGTEDGGTIRIPGKGGVGAHKGPAGDLYVTVRVLPHPYFDRHGNDIQGIVPITVKEAYAGAEIEVPTIHGVVTAKIPPGTQGRQRFRLRGKGVKDPRTGSTGDHIYISRIMIPRTQSPAGLDAATLLDSLYEGNVRAELPKGL